MNAIRTHAFVAWGYDQTVCAQCRLPERDRCHKVEIALPAHACPLCTCAEDLSDHCEGHLELARAVGEAPACEPCPRTGLLQPGDGHRAEFDYDRSRYCPACTLAGL